jgi:hypothetical protein
MTLKEKIDTSVWQLTVSVILGQITDKIYEDVLRSSIHEIQSISVGVWESQRYIVHNVEGKLKSYDFKR